MLRERSTVLLYPTLNSLFVLCKFTSFFRCKLAASDMHSNKSTEP